MQGMPPVVIGYGNLVVWCPLSTPLEASSHQLYLGSPRDCRANHKQGRLANVTKGNDWATLWECAMVCARSTAVM
jgi:hypothetical protein